MRLWWWAARGLGLLPFARGNEWGALYLVLCSFLPVYVQYSREAHSCEGFKLVTELLLAISMLFYLWLLHLLVTLFYNYW